MKRNIEGNVLRIFMRTYARGNVYAYDQMIDALAEKLPNILRVIRYDDMIADPAAALRTAADFCGRARAGTAAAGAGQR